MICIGEFFVRAATDDFPVRDTLLDKIDELEIVSALINRMPNVFAEALGAVDASTLVSLNAFRI